MAWLARAGGRGGGAGRGSARRVPAPRGDAMARASRSGGSRAGARSRRDFFLTRRALIDSLRKDLLERTRDDGVAVGVGVQIGPVRRWHAFPGPCAVALDVVG